GRRRGGRCDTMPEKLRADCAATRLAPTRAVTTALRAWEARVHQGGAWAMTHQAAPPVRPRCIAYLPVGSPTDEAAGSRPCFPLPRPFAGRQCASGVAHPGAAATLRAFRVRVEIPPRDPRRSECRPLRLRQRQARRSGSLLIANPHHVVAQQQLLTI